MKNLLLKIFIFFFLLNFSAIYSQYTEVINSNKPGFSESPYGVGTGVYQLESNLFVRNTSVKPTFSRPKSFGFDMLFRTGFLLEKLELNAQVSFQRDQIAFKNIFTSTYFSTGFSKVTIGAKYLLFQQEYEDKSKETRSWKRRNAFDKKRLTPSIALYVGLNTNFVNDIYKTESISPKIGLLFQQNLSTDFNLVSNFFYDKIGTNFFEYSYIVTGTYNFNDRWSTFFENQTVVQKDQNNTNLGTGLAFLCSKNLQINTSARYLIEGNSKGLYTSFGLSYRIDAHKDAYTDLNENGRKIKNTPISRYEKKKQGFFTRLFSVFKKKKTRKRAKRKRKRN